MRGGVRGWPPRLPRCQAPVRSAVCPLGARASMLGGRLSGNAVDGPVCLRSRVTAPVLRNRSTPSSGSGWTDGRPGGGGSQVPRGGSGASAVPSDHRALNSGGAGGARPRGAARGREGAAPGWRGGRSPRAAAGQGGARQGAAGRGLAGQKDSCSAPQCRGDPAPPQPSHAPAGAPGAELRPRPLRTLPFTSPGDGTLILAARPSPSRCTSSRNDACKSGVARPRLAASPLAVGSRAAATSAASGFLCPGHGWTDTSGRFEGVSVGPRGVVTLCREEVSDFTDVLGGALEETPQTPLFPPTAPSRPPLWDAGLTADSQWGK